MARLHKRIDDLLARAMKLEHEAQALREESYDELAYRLDRNAYRLRRKLIAAWGKMTLRRMSAHQYKPT